MLQHPLPCYFSFYCSLAATGNVLAGRPTLAPLLFRCHTCSGTLWHPVVISPIGGLFMLTASVGGLFGRTPLLAQSIGWVLSLTLGACRLHFFARVWILEGTVVSEGSLVN